jgi:SHS family lactate transporter-like MFS transporter
MHAMFSSTGSWIGNIYDLTIVTYIYVELEKSYNIGLGAVSLLFSLGLIGRFFGGLYLGKMTDRNGAKNIMIISTAGYAIFNGIMAFSPDIAVLFIARFIQGIFMGGEWTSGTVLGYEFSPANIRSTVFGVIQSGYGIGYALTGVTYLLFLPTMAVNWRYFLITGSIPIIIVPYAMLKVPRDRIEIVRKKINLKNYKIPLIKATVIMSGYFAASFSIFSFYPTIAPTFGVPDGIVGLMMILSSLTISVSFILFGRLALKIRKRTLIITGALLTALFAWFVMPFLILFRPFELEGFILFSVGISSMTIPPLLLMDRINPEVRGVISGFSYNFGALFGGVIAVLLGFIGNYVGYHSLLLIIDITTLLCLSSVIITGLSIKKIHDSSSYKANLQ